MWVNDGKSKLHMWFGGGLGQCGKRSERHEHWDFVSEYLSHYTFRFQGETERKLLLKIVWTLDSPSNLR